MRFGELRVGDFFEAYGATFVKLPPLRSTDLPGANAVNAVTGQLACFGPTVPVEYANGAEPERPGDRGQRTDVKETTLVR
jgi:hypothetical protein